MNAFSGQGKALLTEVRNQIIEKWLSNEVEQVYRDNQSYHANMGANYYPEIAILLTVFYGRFDCPDILAVPSLLNHLSIFDL